MMQPWSVMRLLARRPTGATRHNDHHQPSGRVLTVKG